MLIIKGATPAVARQNAIRCALNRIDVDRDKDLYDIYFNGDHGIQIDYTTVGESRFANFRIHSRTKLMTSFQINLKDIEKVVII